MPKQNHLLLRLLAGGTTLTAIAMAAASAWDRGGSASDRVLLVALSAIVCLGAHLLLALSRRRVAWLLWSGCLALALIQHLTFFTHASLRAGQLRAAASVHIADIAQQEQALNAALATINARSVTDVAAELSQTRMPALRRALNAELGEAQRAARLRDELVALAATATMARVTEAADPVTQRLAAVIGRSEVGLSTGIGLVFAVILELTGALLWFEALRPVANTAAAQTALAAGDELRPVASYYTPVAPVSTDAAVEVTAESPCDLTELQQVQLAVDAGLCKPTVAGIRVFKGCGQARALELRRNLAVGTKTLTGPLLEKH